MENKYYNEDFKRFKRIDIQRNYTFKVTFPYIPLEFDKRNIEIQCSKLTVPGKEKKTKPFRFLNSNFNQSMGNTNTNEFPITFILDQNFEVYDMLIRWYNSVDILSLPILNPSQTVNMEVKFLTMDTKRITKIIYINNVFPTSIPDISLDQFSEGEIIFLECRFAYEDINYAEYGQIGL